MLRQGSEVEDIIGAHGRAVYRERWMPQLMTTLRSPQYGPALFLWHIAKIPIAFFHTRRLLRKWKIDLVHLNESTLLPYVFIAWILRTPVVLHARGATAQRPIEQFLLRVMGKLGRCAIIAIDEETVKSLPPQTQPIATVVYNPIDMGGMPSQDHVHGLRASWGCSPDDVVVGQVASLHTSKGIWDILDLAADLCPMYPSLKFVLVGDDRPEVGEGPKLREVIARRGLCDRVVLPGYVENLAALYGSLDIVLCLFSSGLGGVGRTAYEAALAGKPLIATLRNPAGSQTIRHGIDGLVFKPEDKSSIVQALHRLIQSESTRRALGESAKQHMADRHLPSGVASQVNAVYQMLLSPQT